ncbi:Phytanoyl-CoA dioxygenase (PhyH) [Bythopirellula polymerisocia]|uniref:Phytanoyl-CoA dioxygenase (PhyH) n=2 Tax=Bythopirellula polymerisocia TaxID=2528003 RepID=A0A5C6CMY2_9BACT|nr:Phytanoyl-CoA dioxygenase (PhyH) [Bythopirellula polymerisocia]
MVYSGFAGKDPSLANWFQAGSLLFYEFLVDIAMNMHPKVRPLWQRALIIPVLGMLLVYKALKLPRRILPRDLRAIVRNWHYSMFWTLIKSGLTQAFIDEPCTFNTSGKHFPKAEVAPEFRMTEDDFTQFHRDGFIGPFDAFSKEEMAQLRQEMLAVENANSETYGFVTPRDRHLESPRLWEHMNHPAIVERVAQILGPDLLCWRTQLFYKGPGAPAIQFHQASTFMVEDYLDPAIYPPRMDEMFQLTVWVAVDDAVPENGCMQFIRGSHDRIHKIKFGGEEGFYKANFSLDFDRDPARVVTMPVKSGQFIIFTERCIHGSPANTTDRYRLAFNLRIVPTNVPVLTGKEKYRSVYNGGKYNLKNWGVALLRGEDRHHLSKTVVPARLEKTSTEDRYRSAA